MLSELHLFQRAFKVRFNQWLALNVIWEYGPWLKKKKTKKQNKKQNKTKNKNKQKQNKTKKKH